MKTGMTRPVDDLGCIVIPKEIRRNMGIDHDDYLEIGVEDGSIILTKVSTRCEMCGAYDGLKPLHNKFVCADCVDKIRMF